jgi:hypothetical protein
VTTAVGAQRGITNMHVLFLWLFDLIGVHPIADSLRPLVVQLALRTEDANTQNA